MQVVPRAWTHLLAEATGAPVDGATPGDWRDAGAGARATSSPRPASPTAGPPAFVPWEGGPGAEDDKVDRAVRETREAVFPHLGLDPMRVDG